MGRWKLVYEKSDKELEQEHRWRVGNRLPKILSSVDVWCRNGDVCAEATKCKDLLCKYKESKEDVAFGCVQCLSFQLSLPSNNWNGAKLVYVYADVEIEK